MDIKFRLWDKEYDTMEYPTSSEILPYSECYINNNPKLCELMQYTGLKDKNGKKIYEGDILKTDGKKSYAVVIYDECGFCCKVYTIKGERIYRGIHSTETYKKGIAHEREVIGNIFENPELLPISLKA